MRGPWTARRLNQSILKEISPEYIHWKDWCWIWRASTLVTRCEELTHWKSPWCWKNLKAEGEGDDRGWDGLMASLTVWTWVWVSSGSCWGTACSRGVTKSRTRLSDWTQYSKNDDCITCLVSSFFPIDFLTLCVCVHTHVCHYDYKCLFSLHFLSSSNLVYHQSFYFRLWRLSVSDVFLDF